MSKIKNVSIDVTKIDKNRLAKGKYLDLSFVYNKNGEDQYGNAGFITQAQTKEERQAKQRMPIIGNFKVWSDDWSATAKNPPAPPHKPQLPSNDDIPF